eukprot:11032640-Lingulodinium_polyedra.AAC.1
MQPTAVPDRIVHCPTDAKECERERRNAEKEQGIVRVAKKRTNIMEDHFDNCGDDVSSFHDKSEDAL